VDLIMGMRSTFNQSDDRAPVVESLLDKSAYAVVSTVEDNIASVVLVADNIQSVIAVSEAADVILGGVANVAALSQQVTADKAEILAAGDVVESIGLSVESARGEVEQAVSSITTGLLSKTARAENLSDLFDKEAATGNLLVRPTGAGGIARSLAAYLNEQRRSVVSFGADPTGATNCAPALSAAFSQGGSWYVPAGNYLIARPAVFPSGADSGGVVVTVTSSIDILCHPQARFFTDDLDNDLFVFAVPAQGIGVPIEGVTLDWSGGIIDQSNQRTSTTAPFTNVWAPVKQGTSGTCDGISFRMAYRDVMDVARPGAKRVSVRDVSFISGTHWQTAGGDSAIFLGGGPLMKIVEGCTFKGTRDLSIYNSSTGAFTARGNQIEAAFFGIASKRSTPGFEISGNKFKNCVAAIVGTTPDGGAKAPMISGNVFEACTHFAILQLTEDARVWGNFCISYGAALADGVTLVNPYNVAAGYWLRGATRCHIIGEACHAYGPAWPSAGSLVYIDQIGGTLSTYNKIIDVSTTNFSRVVEEATDGGDYNRVEYCYNFGTIGLRDPLGTGGNSSAIRIDPENGRHNHRRGMDFPDGTSPLPTIARRSSPGTGVYFGSGLFGVSVDGVSRVRVGVGNTEFEDRVRVDIGTASAPAYAFVLEPTMGAYRAGTGRYGISAGGVQRVEINTVKMRVLQPLEVYSRTTAERAAMAPDGAWTIYNSDTGQIEAYQNGEWAGLKRLFSRPKLVSGVSYPIYDGATLSATAAGTPDTLYLYPFLVDSPMSVAFLNSRVVTGGTGSSTKVGIWASSNGRPTGLPLAADNTGLATATSAQTRNHALVTTITKPGWYWVGYVFTGTAPIFSHASTNSMRLAGLIGAGSSVNSVSSPVMAIYTAFVYAGDLEAFDLTSAAWSYATGIGTPVFSLTVA
jgi:hypothetical protein